jgi:acetyl-CoA carboxylase biotin carboxyl carrier protein
MRKETLMSTNPVDGPKPEKKKKVPAAAPAPKKLKVSPKLAIVQDVIALMDAAGIGELSFEQAGVKVHVRKGAGAPFPSAAAPMTVQAAPATTAAPIATVPAAAPATPAAPKAESGTTLNSPMVGTFYRAPKPDAKPFIQEGDKVEAGQVYCIIEAMKLMNEVKAEAAGKVVKILAQNGQAVEFNQPLIVIDPS